LFWWFLRDKIERKSQILYTTFASVIALIIAATAQSYFVLEIASLLIELLYSASTYFAISSLIERTRRTG
jgi:predicted MFS family arabinose efflux permease